MGSRGAEVTALDFARSAVCKWDPICLVHSLLFPTFPTEKLSDKSVMCWYHHALHHEESVFSTLLPFLFKYQRTDDVRGTAPLLTYTSAKGEVKSLFYSFQHSQYAKPYYSLHICPLKMVLAITLFMIGLIFPQRRVYGSLYFSHKKMSFHFRYKSLCLP